MINCCTPLTALFLELKIKNKNELSAVQGAVQTLQCGICFLYNPDTLYTTIMFFFADLNQMYIFRSFVLMIIRQLANLS